MLTALAAVFSFCHCAVSAPDFSLRLAISASTRPRRSRLAESGRQLDANVVHLPPGHRVDTHREPDLDVLLLVLAGHGTLTAPDGPHPLPAGTLTWLPHGSTRSLAAGTEGLTYLTVHRRRPGMRIQSRPPGS